MRLQYFRSNLAFHDHLVVDDQISPVFSNHRPVIPDREDALRFGRDTSFGESDDYGALIDQFGKSMPELVVYVEECTDDLTGEGAVQ